MASIKLFVQMLKPFGFVAAWRIARLSQREVA